MDPVLLGHGIAFDQSRADAIAAGEFHERRYGPAKTYKQKIAHMKNKTIAITSQANGAVVAINRGGRKIQRHRFPNIAAAIDHILPLGNRNTELRLNGFKTVLNGWLK